MAVTKQMCFVAIKIFDWVVEGLKQDGGQMITGECFQNLIVYCMYQSTCTFLEVSLQETNGD